MNFNKWFPCPLSLSRAGHVSHKHREMFLHSVHIRVLTREERSEGFIIHDFSDDFVDKNPHALVTAHFFEKSPWQATFNLRLHWRDSALRLLPLDDLLGRQLMLNVFKRHSVRHRVRNRSYTLWGIVLNVVIRSLRWLIG